MQVFIWYDQGGHAQVIVKFPVFAIFPRAKNNTF